MRTFRAVVDIVEENNIVVILPEHAGVGSICQIQEGGDEDHFQEPNLMLYRSTATVFIADGWK